MINANELRLGNALERHDGKIVRVCVDILKDIQQELTLLTNPPKKPFRPIPLSEDWLIKFGKVDYGILIQPNNYPQGDLFIDFIEGKGCYLQNCNDGYQFGKEIKYVHQLQNLYYSLTNEELTIK